MADIQGELGDQEAKEAARAKLLRAVKNALRDNREALFHLPEMFEQLIDKPEGNMKEAREGHDSGETRYNTPF